MREKAPRPKEAGCGKQEKWNSQDACPARPGNRRAAAKCVRHKAGCMEIVLLGGRIIAKALYGQLAAEGKRGPIKRKPAESLSANVCRDRTILKIALSFVFWRKRPAFSSCGRRLPEACTQEEFCLTNRRLWDMINAMAVKRTSRPRRIRCRESLFGGKGPESAC